jgi:hypothetical protein
MLMRYATALFLLAATQPCGAGAATFNWEDASVGQLPAGWTATRTGAGGGSVWQVAEDPTAPGGAKTLAQVSPAGPNKMYNLCVAEKPRFQNVDMSVAMKAIAGKLDQGGGLVWRYRDANNYYLCRMNPLEANFRLYKVAAGVRTQLGTVDFKAAAGVWHRLRITQAGKHIACYFNGKKYLDVTDDTFTDAGRIALWTKADAQTRFADLRATAIPAE